MSKLKMLYSLTVYKYMDLYVHHGFKYKRAYRSKHTR